MIRVLQWRVRLREKWELDPYSGSLTAQVLDALISASHRFGGPAEIWMSHMDWMELRSQYSTDTAVELDRDLLSAGVYGYYRGMPVRLNGTGGQGIWVVDSANRRLAWVQKGP